MPWKSHLRTTIRRVKETAGFVVFPKCFVVFSKCCLRDPSGACRATIAYVKTPEQARVNRRSAPMLCKDTTFFTENQIARFRVNISRSACAPEGIAQAKKRASSRGKSAVCGDVQTEILTFVPYVPPRRHSRSRRVDRRRTMGYSPARWLHHHLIIPFYI